MVPRGKANIPPVLLWSWDCLLLVSTHGESHGPCGVSGRARPVRRLVVGLAGTWSAVGGLGGAQPLSSAANVENNQTQMYECGPCSRSRVSRTLWAGHCITSCELESFGIKFSPGAGDWLGRVVGLALISVGSRG